MEETPEPQNLRQTLRKKLMDHSKEDAPEGFFETIVVGAVAFGLIGAVSIGYASKRLGIPAVVSWAGSQLAIGQAAGTALAGAGSFIGLSAAGWIGGVSGLAFGALINAIPLTRKTIPAKTEYVLKHKILTLDMEEKVLPGPDGRITIRPEDFPKLAERTEHETRHVTTRVDDLAEDLGAVGGGLSGLFLGAALGTVIATIKKGKDLIFSVNNDFRGRHGPE